jgi:hypothetical protein
MCCISHVIRWRLPTFCFAISTRGRSDDNRICAYERCALSGFKPVFCYRSNGRKLLANPPWLFRLISNDPHRRTAIQRELASFDLMVIFVPTLPRLQLLFFFVVVTRHGKPSNHVLSIFSMSDFSVSTPRQWRQIFGVKLTPPEQPV